MDRLDAMRAFAAVADRRSFSEAARRLRLSPAAVTRAVAQLEDRLGLMLLNRTTRSVGLTSEGAAYLVRCKQILADIEDAEGHMQGTGAAPRGRLTVAAPLSFGRLHVLSILNGMLRDHPDLSVRLMLSDRIVHLAEEGVDVAIRIGDPADSALVAIKLGEVRRVVSASPDYLARHGKPLTPADLARHDVIAFDNIDATDEWRFGEASVRVEPRLIVNSAEAAIETAIAGLGVTRTLSYQVAEALVAGQLELVLEAFGPPPVPVNIIHPPRRLGSANVAAFTKAARLQLASLFAPAQRPAADTRAPTA